MKTPPRVLSSGCWIKVSKLSESSFEWLINSLRTEVMSYKYVKVEDAEVLPSGIKQ